MPIERFLSLYLVLRVIPMRAVCFPRGRILLLMLFIGSHLPLFGCSDDSRTSGTMVQVSEEDKKYIESRRDKYKAIVKDRAQARKDQFKAKKAR